MLIRHLEPGDYHPIISVLNDWWGGRKMDDMLPKLFFTHFRETSFAAEEGVQIIGFLVGFLSQTFPDEAYIHFVGVHPDFRKRGVGRSLYERFLKTTGQYGRNTIRCVTAPINKTSIAFHTRMGFQAEPHSSQMNGVSYYPNYDGAGEDRVLFIKRIEESA